MKGKIVFRMVGSNTARHKQTSSGKKDWRDPVSFEYRSYHRSKVELFSGLFPTNRVQVMIVVC